MKKPQEETMFTFGISRIKDLEFYIDESAEVDENLTSAATFKNDLNIYLEDNRIDFIIEVSFFVKSLEDTFMRGKVLTSFSVPDMRQYMVEGTDSIDIPQQGLITLLSISVSHTRALIAKASMGSRYNNLYVPIVNPTEMIKELLQRTQEQKQ